VVAACRRIRTVPLNPHLDSLSDCPFAALRALLAPVTPRRGEAAIRVLPGGCIARIGQDGGNPGEGYIRLALVQDEPTLETAFARMRRVL
jgi:hypothetical protein